MANYTLRHFVNTFDPDTAGNVDVAIVADNDTVAQKYADSFNDPNVYIVELQETGEGE